MNTSTRTPWCSGENAKGEACHRMFSGPEMRKLNYSFFKGSKKFVALDGAAMDTVGAKWKCCDFEKDMQSLPSRQILEACE